MHAGRLATKSDLIMVGRAVVAKRSYKENAREV